MQGDSGVVGIINTAIIILIIILIALVGFVFFYYFQSKKKSNGTKAEGGKVIPGDKKPGKSTGVEPMSKFLDFDEIVDSMIVRKNKQQYVMVIQCKGVNFDLLGEEEKLAIESGFTQFLNTLRFPIQLYVQTRSLNLNESIDTYRAKVDEVRQDIARIDANIRREQSNGRMDLVRKLEFEKRRKENILEYGIDISEYIARMSQNRNVLQQNTYVVVAYYTSEFGGEIQNYSKEEIDNIAFSELYTRAQTLIRGLSSAGVSGRVLQSEELAELLFIAYNRDESDILNIRKMVESQYDSLYNTAKDVMEKQKEIIEKKIDEEAMDLAANSIRQADRKIKLRRENKNEIKSRATQYIEQYKHEMTNELYNETLNEINKADIGEEESKKQASKTAQSKEKHQERTSSNEPVKKKRTMADLTEEEKKILLERRRRRLAREAQARKNSNIQ